MLAAIVSVLLASTAPDGGVPPKLSCLARHYALTPVALPDGGFAARLDGGELLPFDDGKAKSDDERLEGPDLEDTLASVYPRGAIRRALPGEEAGRVRVDALFFATYGAAKSKVELVPVRFFGRKLSVNRRVAERFARIERALTPLRADEAPLFENVGGTFEWRLIANTARRSAHSFGISLDLNAQRSDYWDWKKDKERGLREGPRATVPQRVVDAFEAEGFAWGGRWYHFDTMHFEFRPELFDEGCR